MTDIDPDTLRRELIALSPTSLLRVTLLMVANVLTNPDVYEVPISAALADELAQQCAESAKVASDAELRRADPGFTPSAQQWLYSPIEEGRLATIEALVKAPSHPQYDRTVEFGRKSLLVLRVRNELGADLGRMYQAFSPEKALGPHSKLLALWSGERFEKLTEEPLVIDRVLRLIALDSTVVMQSAGAFEKLFGALPELRAQALQTYRSSIGTLDIVGADDLATACANDLNMMRKLISIQAKLNRPGYADAVNMPALLAFLGKNPHIDVPVDRSGDEPRLVFSRDAQHRWAILKLLDDDFLRSDLTDITYEANSKTEI